MPKSRIELFTGPLRRGLFLIILCSLTNLRAAEPTKANSEENYRALRDAVITESYSVNEAVLARDQATIQLHSGRISFASPVLGRVVLAVFRGQGSFLFTPPKGLESDYLNFLTQQETVSEPFDRLVLWFSDDTYEEVRTQCQTTELDESADSVLRNLRSRLRQRTDKPRSLLEALLHSDEPENIEAEILAHLYDDQSPGTFQAYVFGKKHDDLRYFVRPRGALRQVLGPEEVTLINFNPGGKKEGIWYLDHLQSEKLKGIENSNEDRRAVDVELALVGTRTEEKREGDRKVSAWKSENVFAVAGFNLGRFKKKRIVDSETKFEIEGLATNSLPDYLKGAEEIGGMSPVRLLEGGLVDAQNSIRVFRHFFGDLPYNRIAITQSGVSNDFKMLVPVYLDFGEGPVRLGQARIIESSSTSEFSVRLPRRPKRVLVNALFDILSSNSR